MKTLQSGLILLGVAISLQLFGRGLFAMSADNAVAVAALLGQLLLCASYVVGVLGLYRVLVGALVHGTAHPTTFAIDMPTPSVLRYVHGERSMIITLDFHGSTPRLYESAIRAWDAPYDNDRLDDAERHAILHNIVQHLAMTMPGKIEVVTEAQARAA